MTNLNKSPDVIANGMAHSMGEKAQNMARSLETVAQNLGSDLGKAASNVSEKTSEYVKSTRSYVEENPLQSIAIAATAGLVVGSLITMISSRRS